MKIHTGISEDIVLLELGPTRHYVMYNKWDLYELLLDSDKPHMKFEIEDFPMKLEELQELAKSLIKEKSI